VFFKEHKISIKSVLDLIDRYSKFCSLAKLDLP